MYTYTALEWAKYIVTKCVEDNHPISNLQLQKILYFIQKEFLKRGKIAFSDEVEAWPLGPVVPSAYYYFCGFGAMTIIDASYKPNISSAAKSIADPIIEQKRAMSTWSLVEETHKENGSWDKVFKDGLGNHQVIPLEFIRREC